MPTFAGEIGTTAYGGARKRIEVAVGLTRTMVTGVLAAALALSAVGCGGDDDAGLPLNGGANGEGDTGDGLDGGDSGATPAGPDNVEDLITTLYGALAANDAATACALFSPSALVEFYEAHEMPTCEAAVDSIAQEIEDPDAFAHPAIELDDPAATEVDEYCGRGISVDIPEGAGDGAIAAFRYSQQPDGTWLVTRYNTNSCGG
jgi:hypothetical protein